MKVFNRIKQIVKNNPYRLFFYLILILLSSIIFFIYISYTNDFPVHLQTVGWQDVIPLKEIECTTLSNHALIGESINCCFNYPRYDGYVYAPKFLAWGLNNDTELYLNQEPHYVIPLLHYIPMVRPKIEGTKYCTESGIPILSPTNNDKALNYKILLSFENIKDSKDIPEFPTQDLVLSPITPTDLRKEKITYMSLLIAIFTFLIVGISTFLKNYNDLSKADNDFKTKRLNNKSGNIIYMAKKEIKFEVDKETKKKRNWIIWILGILLFISAIIAIFVNDVKGISAGLVSGFTVAFIIKISDWIEHSKLTKK